MLRQVAIITPPQWSRATATPRRERWIGIASAAALHVVAIGALLQYQPAREALLAAAPIMVNLITPAKLEVPPAPPKPKPKPIEKPRPQPVVEKPIEPPPIITAPIEAPAPFVAPPPPPEPEPVAAPAPEPAPAPPPPVVPPRFNADYLQNPAPPYPSLSRRMGEQGKVILRVLVSADGNPDKVELRKSSGWTRLDQSALETVKRWKFIPARQGDHAIPAWVLVPISFTLEG